MIFKGLCSMYTFFRWSASIALDRIEAAEDSFSHKLRNTNAADSAVLFTII